MTVSAVTIGSTTGAVVGMGAGQLADPHNSLAAAGGALAFTGAPDLALEAFVGVLLVMAGTLLAGLARRHRARPAVIPVASDYPHPPPEDPPRT